MRSAPWASSPTGARLIARRTKLKAGDQQSFADHDGYRLAIFMTDQTGDAPALDLCHRGHACVEARIRQAKDCGLCNLPFRSFAHNEVWLWLVILAQEAIGKARCAASSAAGATSMATRLPVRSYSATWSSAA